MLDAADTDMLLSAAVYIVFAVIGAKVVFCAMTGQCRFLCRPRREIRLGRCATRASEAGAFGGSQETQDCKICCRYILAWA